MLKNSNLPPNPKPGMEPPIKIVAGKKKLTRSKALLRFIVWVAAFGGVVFIALAAGSFAGYRSGIENQNASATVALKGSVDEQFNLALQDIAAQQYDIAYQRLEFVINQDPSYPSATDKIAEVMAILYATATPTAVPPTITPTPTQDLRPVEDLFGQAKASLAEQKWDETLDTLTNLRKADPTYQTARVDGMMFIALRMRGFDKIWKFGDLEGGLYDLALANRFGPLDTQSISARDLARLYLFGSSFWEVDPVQAIQYFSQVAAAAPGLQDASGWTASARYREVLIQYGDKLMAAKDWCNAQRQYELALSMGADATLQEKTRNAALACTPPTATPSPTGEMPSATPTTETLPPAYSATPTNTQVVAPPTNTSAPPTQTSLPPTNTSAPPTDTSAPPTDTSVPPADTPVPPADTPQPPSSTQTVSPPSDQAQSTPAPYPNE
jgi:tetratricopeptide (TPR) repeat protein